MKQHGDPAIHTEGMVPKEYRGAVNHKQRKSNNNFDGKSIECSIELTNLKHELFRTF